MSGHRRFSGWLSLGLALLWLAGLPRPAAAARPAAGAAPTAPTDLGWATQVVTGVYHTCALTTGGGVQCWGDNTYGQLGDGTTRSHALPVDVAGLTTGVVQLSAGDTHTCALTTAGGVLCWGADDYGLLGVRRVSPTPVVGLGRGVRAISAGGGHTVALLADGRLLSWGSNQYGELGDGTQTDRLAPVAVVDLAEGVQAVSAGAVHTCAVVAEGEAWCWGNNRDGQLGDGTWTGRLTPGPVRGLAGVAAVSAASAHTCAVTGAGAAWCWGDNRMGQLGTGRPFSSATPQAVMGLEVGVAQLSAGGAHTCVVTVVGGVWCWGSNFDGALGDGTTTYRRAPVPVVGLGAGVRSVSVRGIHSCAVLQNGAVYCWGDNAYGQLGDGTTTRRLTPTPVLRDLAYDCAAAPEPPATECAALVTLFKASNGPLWRQRAGWLQTATPCSWDGVTCVGGRVSRLALADNGLGGALPAALAGAEALTALQELDLHGNDLDGELPANLGAALPALRVLNLAENRLSGPLPASLAQLAQLETLDLHRNALVGPLPEALGQLAQLATLDLHANYLTGAIPTSLGELSRLAYLDLGHNTLSQFSPAALARLGALRHLDLSANQLGSELSWDWWAEQATLGQLTALRYLDLSANQLGGPLPWWPELPALQHLDLSANGFDGSLPAAVAGLPELTYVALHTNHLSGSIPATWGQLGAQLVFTPTGTTPPPGVYIDLSVNHLYGPIPAELGQNPALKGLQLAGNALSGLVPEAILRHPFAYLGLDYNQLQTLRWEGYWLATQTVAPTALQATAQALTVTLTWEPPPFYDPDSIDYAYEISYATVPAGPFTVHGRTPSNQFKAASYTLADLAPGTYYFRVRTFTAAHRIYDYFHSEPVFAHAYVQPNNLWSDYTPLVSVTVGGTPTPTATPTATPTSTPGSAQRIFLPLMWR